MGDDTWIVLDLETTGLDPRNDNILEVAAIAVDPVSLEEKGRFHSLVLNYTDPSWWAPIVREMHTTSGLIAEREALIGVDGAYKMYSTDRVDRNLAAWVRPFGPKPRLAGNSVQFDKEFLRCDMVATHDLLSHRIVDVSTLRDVTKTWLHYPLPEGPVAHRAMADCESSLAQLRWFRERLAITG